MGNKTNNFKRIILVLLIIIVVTISFVVHNKLDNKVKEETKIEEIGRDIKPKNTDKSIEDNASKDRKDDEQTNSFEKGSDKKSLSENSKNSSSEEKAAEITAFVEEANFGSTVEIKLNSNSSNNYKYYQFYVGNEAISNVEGIEKSKTTLYPSQESGTAVKLKVLDENKKVIKTLDIKLKSK